MEEGVIQIGLAIEEEAQLVLEQVEIRFAPRRIGQHHCLPSTTPADFSRLMNCCNGRTMPRLILRLYFPVIR